MSVRITSLITATTSETTSSGFSTVGTQSINAGVLADGESVKIQYTHNGTDWQDLYLNGVLQEITPKHSIITVLGPGKFRCVKSVTAAAVAVNLWETEAE